MAEDDQLMCLIKTRCAYCGTQFETLITKRVWDSGQAMARCGVCPLPTLLNPHTVPDLPTLVNQTGQSSSSTLSTSNTLPPEIRKPTKSDIQQFISQEISRVKAANPSLTNKEAREVAVNNWARDGHDWYLKQQQGKGEASYQTEEVLAEQTEEVIAEQMTTEDWDLNQKP